MMQGVRNTVMRPGTLPRWTTYLVAAVLMAFGIYQCFAGDSSHGSASIAAALGLIGASHSGPTTAATPPAPPAEEY